MDKNIEKKIKNITAKIVREFQPEKIILFGSYAWDQPDSDSDIDLFIIKDTANTRETAREIDGFIFPRSFALDLLVATPQKVKEKVRLGDYFMNNIMSNGKILYEAK